MEDSSHCVFVYFLNFTSYRKIEKKPLAFRINYILQVKSQFVWMKMSREVLMQTCIFSLTSPKSATVAIRPAEIGKGRLQYSPYGIWRF